MTSPFEQRPDQDDLPHTEWKCDQCGAMNSCLDGECQFCDDWSGDPAPDDIPCIDKQGHDWVVSDENENVCYCAKCGCMEY
jgi:hypothetical protein